MNKTAEEQIEELGEELCNHCPCTDYGISEVNTGYWNLCEGCRCQEAYQNYLEENVEDE